MTDRGLVWLLAVLAPICVAMAQPEGVHLPAGVSVPLGGGGPGPQEHGPCIPPDAEARILSRIAAYTAAHPEVGLQPRGPLLYPIWPQAGNWYQDISATGFVDQDPTSPGFHDFQCEAWTYDTHQGIDCEIKTFGEQAIGVPIFAVLPGTVVDRDDGHPDMNTQQAGQPANYVVLDHGGGRQTWYLHMRNGSVAVHLGDVVKVGQQLGLTASSGSSGAPHLHFESRQNGVVFEPFAGPCRAGASGWVNQPAIRHDLYIADFAPSVVDMTTAPAWPFDPPRTGQIAITDQNHWIWINVHDVPPNSTYRIRYVRPNGQVEFEAPTYPFNNADFYPRAWYWFWGYYIPDMHSAAGLGTWRIQFDMNGVQVVDAPVEIRTARTSDFNRPPAALQGLAFDPPAPVSSGALFCRVATSLIYDDPDYDLVRYTYVWTVNGQIVRQVTSAALSDAIAAQVAPPGALVTCRVTPSDGQLSGPLSSKTVRVAGGCPADFNGSGGLSVQDIFDFLNAWFSGAARADFDASGALAVQDIFAFLNAWFAGC